MEVVFFLLRRCLQYHFSPSKEQQQQQIHILVHSHKTLGEHYYFGRRGGRQDPRMLVEQLGCQVKIECCALSNQLKTWHDCFLTNNTCVCENCSGNLSRTLFHFAVKFTIISEKLCAIIPPACGWEIQGAFLTDWIYFTRLI